MVGPVVSVELRYQVELTMVVVSSMVAMSSGHGRWNKMIPKGRMRAQG